MIKLENINKSFNRNLKNKNQVLQNVSLTLPDKGLIAIFGKSGSGKTTLLNIIGGLIKPDSGNIIFNNKKLKFVNDDLRNKEIGFIFQNYYLEKNYKITEIIANQALISGITDKEVINNNTIKALDLVEMTRFKNKTGDSLSGGQKQRVAIARALAKDANIILADEPTGNLDSVNTTKVMDILKEISKTKLVVLVTHELSLIEKYADNFIELVDGKIIHNLDENKVEIDEHKYSETPQEAKKIKTGKLFTLNRVIKYLSFKGEERFYSTFNIFRQIFIIVFSVFLTFFAMNLFEINRSFEKDKKINKNAIYTELNTYPELRKLDNSLYSQVNFFESNYRNAKFKLKVFDLIEEIDTKYIPQSINDNLKSEDLLLGRMPNDNEVLISSALLEELKNKVTIKSLKNNKLAQLLYFNNEYKVVGVVKENNKNIYFNRANYINFLKVYSKLSFNDVEEIFFKGSYKAKSYFSNIKKADEDLYDHEAILEINRNSLHKMLANSLDADILNENANSILFEKPRLIQVKDSKLFIKKIRIVKTPMDSDVNLLVNSNVLSKIITYIKPSLSAFKNNNEKYNEYYFEIITNNKKQLSDYFSKNNIQEANIQSFYNERLKEAKEKAFLNVQIYLIISILLFLIYYFFLKSESIKNNKEYGIYRAIGINKSNLLFKELVSAFIINLITFSAFYFISLLFILTYYLISNIGVSMFLLFSAGIYLVSLLILLFISIIPYLFVLYLSPADILARYDI